MTNQKFVVGCDQQNCERRFGPTRPELIAERVADSERFGQTHAIDVVQTWLVLRRCGEREEQEQ